MGNGWVIMGILLLGINACTSYREISIDVLKPANLDLEEGEKIVFVDRKVIHRSDSLSATDLIRELGLTRGDLVEFFYDGLKDGLQWGMKSMKLEKVYGVTPNYVVDHHEVLPLSDAEIDYLIDEKEAAYLLSVEYCKFRLVNNRVVLDDNMLIRLYDAENKNLVDALGSEKLLSKVRLDPMDYTSSIREFMYQKGWSYAEHLVPVWIPANRRIYMDNRLLKMGYYFFELGDFEQAEEMWMTALNQRPSIAAKAAVNVAWLYERTGNFEDASRLLERTRDIYGNNKKKKELDRYIDQQIKILKQRSEDDKKLMNQL